MTDQTVPPPHVLDDPPPYHYKLLPYGERPYWSPDGRRIAFVEKHYGDICEIDMESREVRNLTRDLDCPHLFLRVLILHNGDYLPTFRTLMWADCRFSGRADRVV